MLLPKARVMVQSAIESMTEHGMQPADRDSAQRPLRRRLCDFIEEPDIAVDEEPDVFVGVFGRTDPALQGGEIEIDIATWSGVGTPIRDRKAVEFAALCAWNPCAPGGVTDGSASVAATARPRARSTSSTRLRGHAAKRDRCGAIARFRATLVQHEKSDGSKLSPKRINNILAVLSKPLHYAAESKVIAAVPRIGAAATSSKVAGTPRCAWQGRRDSARARSRRSGGSMSTSWRAR
jgi:hypothetical protein